MEDQVTASAAPEELPAGAAARGKRGRLFPSFRATASDQPRSVENDRFTEARVRLASAFTPSQPILRPGMLAGRTQMLRSLIRSIEDERLHCIIYGERGIGKTSLLHVLSHVAKEARYIVSYVSCGAALTFDEAFRAIAADIPLMYHSSFGPNSAEGERGDTLTSLLPAAPISVRQACDLLAKMVATRIVIVLDEFDRSESAEFRLEVAEFLKSLSDRAIRVQMLIGGVAADLVELIENVPSIQRGLFAMRVPRMSEAEVRDLITGGEERSGLQFEKPAERFLVSAANGLPYLASLLAHHAGLEAIEQSRLNVTAPDVAAAVSGALNDQKSRLSRRAQILVANSVHEGTVMVLAGLSNLAQLSGGPFSLDELASTSPGPEGVARTHELVKKLTEEGTLVESREEYGVTYRFVEDSVPIYLWLVAAQARYLIDVESQSRSEPVTRRSGDNAR